MSKLHKLTIHHARAIRERLTLMGMTTNQLAKHAGVSSSSVYAMLLGRQIASRHVPKILKALGITLDTSSERLRLEVEVMSAIRHLVFKGELSDLQVASRTLNALRLPPGIGDSRNAASTRAGDASSHRSERTNDQTLNDTLTGTDE